MHTDILIKNGITVTQDSKRSVVEGNVWIEDGVISEIGKVSHTSDGGNF